MASSLQNAGYKVTIASPNGGKITIDKVSLQGEAITPDTRKWLDDGKALLSYCKQILRIKQIISTKNGVTELSTACKHQDLGSRSSSISITDNEALSGLDHWMQIPDTTACSIISYSRTLFRSWYCSMFSKGTRVFWALTVKDKLKSYMLLGLDNRLNLISCFFRFLRRTNLNWHWIFMWFCSLFAETAQKELNNSVPVAQIKAESITALYAAGGHGNPSTHRHFPIVSNKERHEYSQLHSYTYSYKYHITHRAMVQWLANTVTGVFVGCSLIVPW